jgi:hypothetical protein
MLKHTVNKVSSMRDFVVVVVYLGTGAVSQVEKAMRTFTQSPAGATLTLMFTVFCI